MRLRLTWAQRARQSSWSMPSRACSCRPAPSGGMRRASAILKLLSSGKACISCRRTSQWRSDARCPIGCDGTRGSSSRHIAMKFSAACSSWLVLSPHCRLAEKRLNCTTVQRRRRSSNSSGSTSPARMRCSRLKACSRGSWRRPTRERRNSRTEPVDGGKFSIEGTRNDLLLMVTGKIISLALPLPHVGSHHGLTDCRARREPALS